jgi:hypothetical protein
MGVKGVLEPTAARTPARGMRRDAQRRMSRYWRIPLPMSPHRRKAGR